LRISLTGNVDVILEDHDIANLEITVQSSGRIRGYQHFDSAKLHYSHWHGYL
jgi:hypothetical protein